MNRRLDELLPDLEAVPALVARHLEQDSRRVAPGDAFVALRGARHDGHDHAAAAVARGAVAVLAEHAIAAVDIPVIVVPQLRSRLAALAARFYREPGRDLYCIGVTGTNGKTSIAHYLADLASRLGYPCGYIGTIGWGRIGALDTGTLTTPDPISVQRQLAGLRALGCRWAVLEASSHALAQDRVSHVPFRAAVFSNLSRDHLDYHGDMAAYGAAKARLFTGAALELAILNRDDAFGRSLFGALSSDVRSLGYGRLDDPRPDITWSDLAFDAVGVSGRWHTPWGTASFRMPVQAEFSVANVAAALGVLGASGVALDSFVAAAANLAPIPGRMEYFRTPGRPAIVIDFAHTPDALAQVLGTLRARTTGRLICVVGCGGDRDRGKRPLMAAVAERFADLLWLTSDNPRSESPAAIIADMRAGLVGRIRAHEEVDRRAAIAAAWSEAQARDLVLIAGKGHEDHQEVGGIKLPFSDRAVVAELLAGVAV